MFTGLLDNGVLYQRFEEIVHAGMRLGRNLWLDGRSLAHMVENDVAAMSGAVTSQSWERMIPILDQGQVGSCTGNAGTGALGTQPFYDAVGKSVLTQSSDANADEQFAVVLDTDATKADGYPGEYPAEDTGSSGLAICKVLAKRKTIKGYRFAWTSYGLLRLLQHGPVLQGMPWYNAFFEPDGKAFIDASPNWESSGLAGGHEVEAVAVEVDTHDAFDSVITYANSWGSKWGDGGYFRMRLRTYEALHSVDIKQFRVQTLAHPDRKDIARYLLSRGEDAFLAGDEADEAARVAPAAARAPIDFPAELAPVPAPIDPPPSPTKALPKADVVVITWTVDEVAALAQVLTPGVSPTRWYPYAKGFAKYKPQIRPHAPAATAKRLGSYMPLTIGSMRVLAMKSELHLNQDGVKISDGIATLPVKDFFQQIIKEAKPTHVLTVGTAGGVFEKFGLGDAVITRAAKFRCQQEFANVPFNHIVYTSDWKIPTKYIAEAEKLMQAFGEELAQPPVGPPTKQFEFSGPLLAPPIAGASIRLDGDDMPRFHPILTTDYFEYGTSANRLDKEGAAVEMGDAALGLACSELTDPPNWAVVRNMSDPVINGDLPAKQFHLNEQTTWAVAYYTAYGRYTSIMSSIASWAIIAGLSS